VDPIQAPPSRITAEAPALPLRGSIACFAG
jgi:hypothetical protein